MNKSFISIIDEYISYNNLYKDQYEKYLVLLQVGSFYEMYSDIQDDPKLKEVCELLNLLMTRKNKSIQEISKNNPHMAGIPCCSLQKYLDVLIDNNYTVLLYDQEDINNSKKKYRKLSKIFSIGTHINCEKESKTENVILSIYRETINSNNICGISTINLSTGDVNVLEIYNENDITKLLEDLNKIIIIHKPKEIIYSYDTSKETKKDCVYNILYNTNTIFHYNTNIIKDYTKINYQNDFLKNVYKNYNIGFLSAIEYLDMEKYNYSTISLIILLNFAYKYDNMIIENINKPNILTDKNVLNLHNNALEQLNIFSLTNNYKYNSLFDVINKNSTKLGSRLLKKMLAEPITNINELNKRYNLVNKLLQNETYKQYENELKYIIDIEKYHKSLGILKLQPYQYGRLHQSYKFINNLINLSELYFKDYFDYELLQEYKKYYNEYLKYFNIDNLEVFSFNNKNNVILNIFNEGIVKEVDEIMNKIHSEKNKLELLSNNLSKLINDDKIEIQCTDKDGYYLILTKNRATKLKKAINDNLLYKDLIFEDKVKASTYITSRSIKDISKHIIINESKLFDIIKNSYYEITEFLYKKYYKLLIYLNYFISYIDVFNSFAKVSYLNNYSKPIIDIDSKKSYMDIKNIRHPIIELLSTSTEYITNDIQINVDNTGMILYGINSSGKSSIMKSVGLNLILAQIGCFTATSEFKFYPYNSIFTRIDHTDNLFKGMSSFEKEIYELKTILNYSNSNSLVLGDELLSSTENISAISIISATINNFLSKDISFLFASHLHNIPKYIDENLKNKLYIGHLKTEYDNINKCFIYNRKLQPGESVKNYGLIVAQNILSDSIIIKDALQIQNKIINNNAEILENKKSKYNSNLIVNKCYICDDNNISKKSNEVLEVHHIVYQSQFKNNKCLLEEKKHIKKNNKSNLVTLCGYHHDQIHNNNIKINGWITTSNGIKLDYNILKTN
jgi:DNA mismatch repair protein MutS